MNSKYLKLISVVFCSLVLFSACEKDEDEGPALGDIVGAWDLSALSGSYTRTIASEDGITLTASWKDAAAVLGSAAALADLTLLEVADDAAAPGFPLTAAYDAAALTAVGISMVATFLDGADAEDKGTYTLIGTYPTIRTDLTTCVTAGTVAPITDQGLYSIVYDVNNVGTLTVEPDIALGDQVLPPFDDGTATFSNEGANMNLKFKDRDAHDVDYAQVQATWSEEDDRVTMGIVALPVDATTGAFSATGDLATEAYIMNAALAAWGGYMTWYAFNINAEVKVRLADVKNPLSDLNGDGTINAVDIIIYMHADNLANAGSKSAFGMPYSVLVNSSNKLEPVPTNDSDHSFDITAAAAGGKMMYSINAQCFPINEIIDFDTDWISVN